LGHAYYPCSPGISLQVNTGANVALRGLVIRHSSPSVANNFHAVFNQSFTDLSTTATSAA
jgi:hypothetical protein